MTLPVPARILHSKFLEYFELLKKENFSRKFQEKKIGHDEKKTRTICERRFAWLTIKQNDQNWFVDFFHCEWMKTTGSDDDDGKMFCSKSCHRRKKNKKKKMFCLV